MMSFHVGNSRKAQSVRRELAPWLVALVCLALAPPAPVVADHTPNPTTVTVAGSLQSELGCPGDFQPECVVTQLSYDVNDDVWQAVFSVPAGNWDYKAALNQSWDENYGLNAQENGANITLPLAELASVKFYYDHKSHWITDNQNSVIATAPGSYQSELGCPGDFQPDCLRSWLQDPDGDGIYTFTTTALPTGNYETKAAIDESWDENYGAGGVPNGPNIVFSVPVDNTPVTFTYNATTHVLTVSVGISVAAPIVTPSPSDEGQSVIASATFTSSGDGPFSCTVDYGDGSGPLPGAVSGTTCTGPSHIYADDDPSGTSSDDYLVTIMVTDEDTGSLSNTSLHTVENVPPAIISITTNGPVLPGQPVTVTVVATDPGGANDPLSYSFDCDDNGSYETAGVGNQGTCTLAPGAASSTVGVRVSDDDLGVATGSTQVAQALKLCASTMTGKLSASRAGGCPTGSVHLTLPSPQPTAICINRYTGGLSWFAGGCPATGWITHIIPGDGPLSYCVSRWTGGLRATFGSQQCTLYELAGVIPG